MESSVVRAFVFERCAGRLALGPLGAHSGNHQVGTCYRRCKSKTALAVHTGLAMEVS
jgi:hypothetical protein